MRQLLEIHADILKKLNQLQKKDVEQDRNILLIFEYLKQLEQNKQMRDEQAQRKRIGYKKDD